MNVGVGWGGGGALLCYMKVLVGSLISGLEHVLISPRLVL